MRRRCPLLAGRARQRPGHLAEPDAHPGRGPGAAGRHRPAGVIQTGQRMGTAAGIALVGSVYFATLSSSHGDDARAAGYGLRIAAALTAVALVVGVVDVLRSRGGGRSGAGSPAAAR